MLVVGAGVNGLACGAYLAAGGVDVVVLEADDHVGGAASTVQALGANFDAGLANHACIGATPLVDELGLADHGLDLIKPDPAQIGVSWTGGDPFILFEDQNRTLDALRATHRYEIENYRSYLKVAMPVAELLLEMEMNPPTDRVVRRRLRHRRGSALSTLMKWGRRSAADVLRSFFEAEALRSTGLVTGPAASGRSPDTPCSGLSAVCYALVHAAGVCRPVGGSGALPAALASSIRSNGGSIRTGATVARIVAEDSGVIGVRLETDEVISGSAVVVACDPRRAVLEWLKPAPLGAESLVRRWELKGASLGNCSRICLALDHLPLRRSDMSSVLHRIGVGEAAGSTTVVSPPSRGLAGSFRLMKLGSVAMRPPMAIAVPSALDRTLLSVDEKEVASIDVFHTPHELAGGWAGSTEPARWLELARDAWGPDFDHALRWKATTPSRIATSGPGRRSLAPVFEGSLVSSVVGRRCQSTGCDTPVDGLFLCGAELGGALGLPGLSGRRAGTAILRSLGADIPAAA